METKIQKLVIFGSAPANGIYNVLSNIGDNVNYKNNCEICVEKFQCHYDTGDNTAFHNIVLSLDMARDSYDNLNAGIICQSKIFDTFYSAIKVNQIAFYDVINQIEFWFSMNKYDLNNLSLKFQTLSNGVLNNLGAVDFVLHLKIKFHI